MSETTPGSRGYNVHPAWSEIQNQVEGPNLTRARLELIDAYFAPVSEFAEIRQAYVVKVGQAAAAGYKSAVDSNAEGQLNPDVALTAISWTLSVERSLRHQALDPAYMARIRRPFFMARVPGCFMEMVDRNPCPRGDGKAITLRPVPSESATMRVVVGRYDNEQPIDFVARDVMQSLVVKQTEDERRVLNHVVDGRQRYQKQHPFLSFLI